jgi:hypothetical protein
MDGFNGVVITQGRDCVWLGIEGEVSSCLRTTGWRKHLCRCFPPPGKMYLVRKRRKKGGKIKLPKMRYCRRVLLP